MVKLKEKLFRAYSTLGMAITAIKNGEEEYIPLLYGIRKKTFEGLIHGTSQIRSMFRDEKLKLTLPECCYYCGARDDLTLDHLIPVKRGGPETADNFIYACRKCNSTKNAKDLMTWYAEKGETPPLYVMQRYIKLVIRYCEENGLMEKEIEEVEKEELPFDLESLPEKLPQPKELKLFVEPKKEEARKTEELKGRTFVFTGSLTGLTRAEAKEIVKKLGAETKDDISSYVTHLVVGQSLWYAVQNGQRETNKIKAAERLQEREHPIQIEPEVEFLTRIIKILSIYDSSKNRQK